MVDSVSLALIISGLIIVIGFLANYIFQKTGFPDMLVLIFVGMLFGPILGIFDPSALKIFSPFVAALALSYTIFDGGMGLNIKQVIRCSPRAITLAVLGFIFSVFAIAAFMMVAFGMPILYGALFGVIFGGSSSVVVVSLVSKIKISEKSATILILESAITDIFTIVIAVALIDVLMNGGATNVSVFGFGIVAKFLVGLVIGLVLGFLWLFVLKKVSTTPFSYILTLGAVILGYACSESLGGSGVLCVLLFGLILGNEREILRFFRREFEDNSNDCKICFSVSQGLVRFQSEIAFLIGTFFFVFLGMIASTPSFTILLSGVLLSILMLVVRYGAVWLTTLRSSFRKENGMLAVILTRGLATAVLATLPAQYGLLYADIFVDISVVVVVATAIMATAGSMLISRRKAI